MSKSLIRIFGVILLCTLLANCSQDSGAPYSNAKGRIVDTEGLIVVANIEKLMPSDSDAAICASLQNPANLPWMSYSTPRGFDGCVARCITDTTRQVCSQFPAHSNFLATQPGILHQMLERCVDGIKNFVTTGTHCPYLNCQP